MSIQPRTEAGRFAPAADPLDPAAVAARVRALLAERKATHAAGPRSVAQLAAALGWGRATVEHKLRGLRPLTRADVEAIAAALVVEVREITGG